MRISDRFDCVAVIIVLWVNDVPDISIQFGPYREYCCITLVRAALRRHGGDTLCVPRSGIDVGGRLVDENRPKYSVHIIPEAAASRFHRRRPPIHLPTPLPTHRAAWRRRIGAPIADLK